LGRAGLINSGGESKGAGDLENAVLTAVINTRGRHGPDLRTQSVPTPMKEGCRLLNAARRYLSKEVTVA